MLLCGTRVVQIDTRDECEEGARDFARMLRAGGIDRELANRRLRERTGGGLWPQGNPKHERRNSKQTEITKLQIKNRWNISLVLEL